MRASSPLHTESRGVVHVYATRSEGFQLALWIFEFEYQVSWTFEAQFAMYAESVTWENDHASVSLPRGAKCRGSNSALPLTDTNCRGSTP